MSISETDKQYVANTYNRFPVELVEGKGSFVKDSNGKKYIDMGSGIGVTAFGLCDPEWQKAVTEQAAKLQHVSNLYFTEPCAKVARLLCEKTGMSKVFFSNSGAEANECAIKYARKYSAEKKGPEYFTIVTLNKSFHGRTLTTLSATGQDNFHSLFNPLTPGFAYADANDLEGLKKVALESKAAGIMIECVQGEGGVNPLAAEFVKGVYDFCNENDIVMIVDEVQTGNGRSGKLYSYMNFDVMPDVVTTAKGIAGGLPMGATLVSKKMESVLCYGDHGSTYGGNPVCAAAAYSVLSRMDDAFLAEVSRKSKKIFDELEGAEGIEGVTGMGLMIGVKTVKPAIDVVKACIDKGVLFLTAKDKVRMLPALNIPDDLIDIAIKTLKEVCKN